jgi:hypothetical protein
MKWLIKHILAVSIALFLTGSAFGQAAGNPHHSESFQRDFGIHDGKITNRKQLKADGSYTWFPEDFKVIRETVRAGAAPWMQVVFNNVQLGNDSYMLITSHFDRDYQFFNAKSISEWGNRSAFFKGNAVDVELFVAPNDIGITARIRELTVGEFLGDNPNVIRDVCGTDGRTSSSVPQYDGRLVPLGCTGWLSAGGFYLTAGHCLDVSSASLQIMEFNVPASLCDGTTQPAAVNDQFPITYSSRVFENGAIGDDWGVYNCGANSNTGLTPAEDKRSYYHLSRSLNPPDIFIRGFGTDNVPTGCTGNRNSSSQTDQIHTDVNMGEFVNSPSSIYFEYQTDTDGGNSGSAIGASGAGVTLHSIGIHTNGFCSPPSEGNEGTSFEADDVEAAMNSYFQTEVEYVDVDHHLSSTNGSSVLPHQSVNTAANQADAGHGPSESALELILIAGSNSGSGGVYAESFSYSGATNGVILRRTVGAVKIGPAATAPPPNPLGSPGEGPADNISTEWVKDPTLVNGLPLGPALQEGTFQLSEYTKVYPNPFDMQATVEFFLNSEKEISIYLINSLGQTVKVLAPSSTYPEGLHSMQLDGSRLAEGMYYVILEGKDFREMHKVSIVR